MMKGFFNTLLVLVPTPEPFFAQKTPDHANDRGFVSGLTAERGVPLDVFHHTHLKYARGAGILYRAAPCRFVQRLSNY